MLRAWTLAAALGLFFVGCESGQIAEPENYGVVWTRITSSVDAPRPVSPDWRGDRIVFRYRTSVGDYPRLAIVRPDGSDLTYLSAGSFERDTPARWADDSTLIFASDRSDSSYNTWLRVVTTDQIQKLTAFPSDEFGPDPRPGTTGLAYIDGNEVTGRVTLIPDYLAPAPEQFFLTPPGMGCGQVDWDPTGTRICFSADSTFKYRHIWMITLASGDSTPVQLTSGPYYDSAPRFSPDGTRILFASNSRTGRPGVWTVAPSGDPATLKVVAFDDLDATISTPCWSPDGTKVVVSSDGRGERALWLLSNLP